MARQVHVLSKIGNGGIFYIHTRNFAEACGEGSVKKGVVIGAYDGCTKGEFKLTNTGEKINEDSDGKLKELLKNANLKKGKALVFTNLSNEYAGIAVAGLGSESARYDSLERMDVCKENIRVASGVGAQALQERGINSIFVEGFMNAEAAAEGAALGVWRFQDNRKEPKSPAKLELFQDSDRDGWQRGLLKADSQNVARRLEETPPNQCTPAGFAHKAIELLCPCGVNVDVRDKDWIESKKMAAFLTMAKGSCEPPLLLEIGYCTGPPDERPVVMTGKGVTFDCGGLNLRKCLGMTEYRGDMAGAAVVVAVMKTLAQMNLPINVYGLIPLCENMMGGMAVKPGDVVLGINGKTIRVEGTDHDGRVLLADALAYSGAFKPCLVLNVSTVSRTTRKSLGSSSSACFTTSDLVWREMERAGADTGDRMWRLPLWKHFHQKITDYVGVDVNNIGKGEGGGPCLAASFLTEFNPKGVDFMHIDISGTGMLSPGVGFPYLRKGLMTGRPTRTVVQFFYQMACPHDKPADECT